MAIDSRPVTTAYAPYRAPAQSGMPRGGSSMSTIAPIVTGAATAATGGTLPMVLGIGQILGGLFGNIFGARSQSNAARQASEAQSRAIERAAEMDRQSQREALDYVKGLEVRDRGDWERREQRLAPYRALGDSAVRTLADYIRVPGMHPAQDVPVQQWSGGGGQMSQTQPVALPPGTPGGRELTEQFRAQNPQHTPGNFKAFTEEYAPFMAQHGYKVEFVDHPSRHDKVKMTDPAGNTYYVDQVVGAGGDNPSWGYMIEGAGGGTQAASGGGARMRANTMDPRLLAKYGRTRSGTMRDLMGRG